MKCTAAEGIKTLVGKVVQFTKEAEEHELDFDTGMLARIKSIHKDSPNWKVYVFVMDFSEFEEHNKPLMECNYYDSKTGIPCETWDQQLGYKESLEKGHHVYLQFEEDNNDKLVELPFEIAPNQLVPPTTDETLDALERAMVALKARNLGKPYKCLDEVFSEANHVLKRANREVIN